MGKENKRKIEQVKMAGKKIRAKGNPKKKYLCRRRVAFWYQTSLIVTQPNYEVLKTVVFKILTNFLMFLKSEIKLSHYFCRPFSSGSGKY